jgi:hypothetical protein
MSDSIKAGEFRICPSCGSRNKAANNYCVHCSAAMDAVAATGPGTAAATSPPRSTKLLVPFVLAAAIVAAIGVGVVIRNILAEIPDVSEDVRADSARAADAPAPPPPVSGWYPGASAPVEPDTAPAWSSTPVPAAPRPNTDDVPADPGSAVVGIAPSPPRVRAEVNSRRVLTEEDLRATRGGPRSTPPPASEDVARRESKLRLAESRVQAARTRLQQARAQSRRDVDVDDGHIREAIKQAADDLEDAQEDRDKAQRKLAEERRQD